MKGRAGIVQTTEARYIAGCDGGLFRSPDRGITWADCNNGLVISEFEYLAQDWGSSRWLIGGTQDNGTNRWAGSPTWEHVDDADRLWRGTRGFWHSRQTMTD